MASNMLDERVRYEIRKAAVQREIFCPVTKSVLDVRSAVLIESVTHGNTLAILSPEGWRVRREALTAVHDSGRMQIAVSNTPKDAPFEPAASSES